VICCVMPAAGGSILGAIVVVIAAIYGIEWVLARIFWILGSAAVIAVVAIAALVPLMRWAARRDAARMALWREAHVPAQLPAQLRAERVSEVPASLASEVNGAGLRSRPAIEHHHYGPQIHVYGPDGEETAARIIRSALPTPDLPPTIGKP